MLCSRRSGESAEGNAIYVLRLARGELVGHVYDFVIVLHDTVLTCTECTERHSALVTVYVAPYLLATVVSVIGSVFNVETEAVERLNRKLYLIACACNVMLVLCHLSPSVIFVNVPEIIGGREPGSTGIAYL